MKNVHLVGTRSDMEFASQNPIQGFSPGKILTQFRVLMDVSQFSYVLSLLPITWPVSSNIILNDQYLGIK